MPWIHHSILHFVLGLAFLPPLLGAIAWWRGEEDWSRETRIIVYLLALAAIATAASGLLSADHYVAGGGDAARVALHRNLALAGAAIWSVLAIATWLFAHRGRPRYRALTVASAIGTLFVSLAGHFGGDMLHPGLLPWAPAPHSHGAGAASAAGSAAHGGDSATGGHGGVPAPGPASGHPMQESEPHQH